MIGKTVTVTIDRPLGTYHPEHPDMYYPVNYGFIAGIMGGDGEELDAYVPGADVPLKNFTGQVIAMIRRRDDVEDKWVAAPKGLRFTRDEIMDKVRFQEQFVDSFLIM